MGTEICGSSSRGVARMPSTPIASDATITSGVSFECRNVWATLPDIPSERAIVSSRATQA